MSRNTKLVLLAALALLIPLGNSQSPQDVCAISPNSNVSDACASYNTLEQLNKEINPAINDLTRTTDFFSHYRVNLFHRTCPFWNDENGMCGNIACAVQTLDNEEDIPKIWRASELGKLEGPSAKHPNKLTRKQRRPLKPFQGGLGANVGESCVFEDDDEDECDERDYCAPEDESATSKGEYVSLVQNPERFTGYAGDGARQVWEAVYRENCFQKSSFPHSAQLGSSSAQNPAAKDFREVLEAAGRQQVLEEKRQAEPSTPFVAKTGLEAEDECLEKRVFYRLMSGMHASINTHLCWDYLNQTTGEWTPNLACYRARLHQFPERVGNVFFNFALVTRAIAKLGPTLENDYTFCSGEPEQDEETRQKVRRVTEAAATVPQIFDESLMFQNGEGPYLKEDFRNRFRNVSRLMDCVGCDKCRLWGKVQTAGYGAALKVLFEFDNDNEVPQLQRTELVALFNTYARLSSSINAIGQFRDMAAAEDAAAAAALDGATTVPTIAGSSPSKLPDRVRKPHNVVAKDVDHEDADEATPNKDQYPTVWESLQDEWGNIVKALKFIFSRYLMFPKLLYEIVTTELFRLWRFFLGLPVPPRVWEFSRPNRDEL